LAKTLDVGLGDRVVGMVSGVDGTVGSELFRVTGLFQSASLSYDKMNIYVLIADAQSMLHVDGRIAEIAAIADVPDSALAIKASLEKALGNDYEVHSYHDLLPNLLSQIELTEQVMLIFFFLIGAAMLFGIVNTLLMSVFERIRELGVLKSMGMRDSQVALMILIEATLLGVIGTIFGVAIAVVVNLVLSRTGLNLAMFSEGLAAFGTGAIIYPVMKLWSSVQEVLVVIVMCLIASIAPIRRAMRLEPVDAIHHV
jgi:putative ABC transport system permease protein